MSTNLAGQAVVDALVAAGADATVDPRSATPPCIFVTPPRLTFDVGCGATAAWSIWALAPGPANLDAWVVLDELLAYARKAKLPPIERSTFVQYQLSADSAPLPAYRIEFTSGVDA
jgi:hypothetical protein